MITNEQEAAIFTDNMKHEELYFEKECRAMARRAGWIACKLEKNGNKGIPDDLFISPTGQCVLVEFKKDEHQRPRPEQQLWLERYPQLAYLVGSKTQFMAALKMTPQ